VVPAPGVLIKNAEALERFEKVDTLVVDKDRNADGREAPRHRRDFGGCIEKDELLRLAASLERGSEHPLAGAILAAAQEKRLTLARYRNFKRADRQGRYR